MVTVMLRLMDGSLGGLRLLSLSQEWFVSTSLTSSFSIGFSFLKESSALICLALLIPKRHSPQKPISPSINPQVLPLNLFYLFLNRIFIIRVRRSMALVAAIMSVVVYLVIHTYTHLIREMKEAFFYINTSSGWQVSSSIPGNRALAYMAFFKWLNYYMSSKSPFLGSG